MKKIKASPDQLRLRVRGQIPKKDLFECEVYIPVVISGRDLAGDPRLVEMKARHDAAQRGPEQPFGFGEFGIDLGGMFD